jgi:putative PIN family toxin of toxin-antitoxin system
MIRVVFDTSILYSATLSTLGPPARAFDLILANLILPCISEDVLKEYREVLFRPELAKHAARATLVLEILASVALHVKPEEELHISRDEDDNRFYECAAAARADYIVTGNLRHFNKPYKGTRIVTARQLLELMESGKGLA